MLQVVQEGAVARKEFSSLAGGGVATSLSNLPSMLSKGSVTPVKQYFPFRLVTSTLCYSVTFTAVLYYSGTSSAVVCYPVTFSAVGFYPVTSSGVICTQSSVTYTALAFYYVTSTAAGCFQ